MSSLSTLIKGFGIGDIDTCIARLKKMTEQVANAKVSGLNVFTGVNPEGTEFGWFTNANIVNAVLAERAQEKGEPAKEIKINDFMLKLDEMLKGTGIEGKKWAVSAKTMAKTISDLKAFRGGVNEGEEITTGLKTKGTTLVLTMVGKQKADKKKPIYANVEIGTNGPQNWVSQQRQKREHKLAERAKAVTTGATPTTEPQQASAS